MPQANDKRKVSKEGFMLADAVIGRVGDLEYTRDELELPGDPSKLVSLSRTRDELVKALPTMVGAPITIDHPTDFVTPQNAGDLMVGSVVSEPVIGQDNKIRAKVRLYRQDAIDLVKSGVDEMSPGFEFMLRMQGEDSGDITGMNLNHIAIVRRGRAGASVRILDSLPPPYRYSHGDQPMSDQSNKELYEIVKTAVDAALSKPSSSENFDTSKTALIKGVTDGLKGLFDEVMAKFDAAQAKDEAAKTKAATDADREALIKEVKDGERARVATIMEALPMIAEDSREGIMDKEADEVLRMAIGDAVPGTENMDTPVLLGVVRGMAAAKDQKPAKPAGVVKASDEKPKTSGALMSEIYAARARDRAKGGT